MSNLLEHAKRELGFLNNDKDFDDMIVETIERFAQYGHSGGSAPYAISVITDLLNFKNLAEITDNPDQWNQVTVDGDVRMWQSRRNPRLFSRDGGRTYYDVNEALSERQVKRSARSASTGPDRA